MRFDFHPLADTEFDEAIRYYEECELGLGLELAEEVYSAIRRVSQGLRPEGCQPEALNPDIFPARKSSNHVLDPYLLRPTEVIIGIRLLTQNDLSSKGRSKVA